MRKTGYIAIGFTVGIFAEIGALSAAFFGTNLFHGGRPNGIANLLLPGIGIVDRLSNNDPRAFPALLLSASLLQFPFYGILAGRDLANKSLSKITIGIIALHICASTLAFYGMVLDMRWRAGQEKYGDCIREHFAQDDAAANSREIIRLVKWIDQSEKDLKKLRAEKANGTVFTPNLEEALAGQLESQREELERRWKIYKDSGGTGKSPQEVNIIPSPCGQPPQRPTLL